MMKLKTLTIFALATMALAGCTTPSLHSAFEPYDSANGKEMFKYWIWASDANNQNDEKERLDTLALWLKKSDYCPNGYKIVSRKTAWMGGMRDDHKKIYYVGVCN